MTKLLLRFFSLSLLTTTLFAASDATPAGQLRVARNFKVDLLYSVPRNLQGSWVTLAVDPKGRLLVSDQYGGLFRVVVPPLGSTEGTVVEKIPVNLGEAQGLLWAFDSLYVVVNRGERYASGLYRVRDTDGDDQLDQVVKLREFEGGGEHGPHAVLLSPDGQSLYIVAGNATKLTPTDTSRVPMKWDEDHLLPRVPDGNGFMRGVPPPGGWICKTDPDGKTWELVAMGFRNEYDAAFNRHGELFSYDADMEWDMNTPWYRPTRVCHVISGAEFGWRNGAGKWPPYYADSVPAPVNIGPGSPTGISFGYGARFPAKYQEALYLCDWSYGKLFAVHLKPDGASYRGEIEEFITGTPLPLTDVLINPKDGAMYFTVGGRRTQSALYRVTYQGRESTAPARENREGEAARALRKKLESFHGRTDPQAVTAAWPHLNSNDRFIRWAARVALEHQDPALWQEQALAEKRPQASLEALLGLARVGAKSLQPRMLESLDRLSWNTLSTFQKLQLLRTYSLVFLRMSPPDAAAREKLARKFDAVFPANDRELNAELSQMMVYLEAPAAAAKIMALLRAAPTQEEQIEYVRALRVLKTGWTPELRNEYFAWYVKAGNYRGGASFAGFLKLMKEDAVATLSPGEKESLKPVLEARPPQVKKTASILVNRATVKSWTVDELAPLVQKGLRKRNYERGKALFGEAGCFACHRFDNQGGSSGPDLTGVSGRFSVRDLLESIIDPSKTISDQYGAVVITKRDGDSLTGRIVNLNGDNVMVNPNLFDPNEIVSVNRRQIQSIENSPMSLMPEGLFDVMKEDEILDLMAYLLSRGDPKHRMFR